MNLRCVFHVRTAPTEAKAPRERMPSVVDAPPPEQQPRGRSFETWSRARGWASED